MYIPRVVPIVGEAIYDKQTLDVTAGVASEDPPRRSKMAAEESKTLTPILPTIESYPSPKHYWFDRVINPAVAAGFFGKLFFGSFVPAAKAASYFGIRESVMHIRGGSPGDLTDSAISGSIVGALLCNLKGFGIGLESFPYKGGRRGAALFVTGCASLTTINDYINLRLFNYYQLQKSKKEKAETEEAHGEQSS